MLSSREVWKLNYYKPHTVDRHHEHAHSDWTTMACSRIRLAKTDSRCESPRPESNFSGLKKTLSQHTVDHPLKPRQTQCEVAMNATTNPEEVVFISRLS